MNNFFIVLCFLFNVYVLNDVTNKNSIIGVLHIKHNKTMKRQQWFVKCLSPSEY